MRISDWSSDVCSSDLPDVLQHLLPAPSIRWPRLRLIDSQGNFRIIHKQGSGPGGLHRSEADLARDHFQQDRKSVVEGKGVSVRVDLGGRRIIKTKNIYR